MFSFKTYLNEHYLSIGLNPDHEKYREQHRQEIHDILHNSYKSVEGGYGGHGSGTEEESKAIHDDISNNMIKAVKRHGKITAVGLFRKQHGRKAIAIGSDGSDQGKKDVIMTAKEGHKQKRDWAEVSGKPEHLMKKVGWPTVPNTEAERLTGKKILSKDEDGTHYTRNLGGTPHKNGTPHKKVIMGHPKNQ
jgi:hypothetical protein